MPTSINQDSFLQQQDIQVEQSPFLHQILSNRQEGVRNQLNLLDIHGRRLSKYWQSGDTFWSVVQKRIRDNVQTILNPDTYTEKSLKEGKQALVRQKVKVLGMMIASILPLSLYYHMVRPKMQRIKRLYTMQFYNKMGFFARQLGVKTKPVSQKDLQDSL